MLVARAMRAEGYCNMAVRTIAESDIAAATAPIGQPGYEMPEG